MIIENKDNIFLRDLHANDVVGMLEWMHDLDSVQFFQKDFFHITVDEVRLFIKSSAADVTAIHFAIVDDKDEYLGTISLKNIDLINKNAEYAIVLRTCARGRGIAAKATRLILKKAFLNYGLKKVYLNVMAENRRAILFYEKFGFVREGVFKSHLMVKNTYQDLYWYAIYSDKV